MSIEALRTSLRRVGQRRVQAVHRAHPTPEPARELIHEEPLLRCREQAPDALVHLVAMHGPEHGEALGNHTDAIGRGCNWHRVAELRVDVCRIPVREHQPMPPEQPPGGHRLGFPRHGEARRSQPARRGGDLAQQVVQARFQRRLGAPDRRPGPRPRKRSALPPRGGRPAPEPRGRPGPPPPRAGRAPSVPSRRGARGSGAPSPMPCRSAGRTPAPRPRGGSPPIRRPTPPVPAGRQEGRPR